jgi:NRPS condensation-like uncharacterized protein
MERVLGAFEHSFWLYDQVLPVHFALGAKISGSFSVAQLRQSLVQVQQQHPLLRVRIEVDHAGQPKFVEHSAPIPLKVLERTHEQQWQQELEAELSRSFDWSTAPLVRVLLLQSETMSELIVTCHHAIADGLSAAYLIRDIVQGLVSQNRIVQTLADCPSIEQLTPFAELFQTKAAKALEQPTQPSFLPQYSTAVSTRQRPHLRTALLSADLTQQLSDRARSEQTTVHGAISAAFLLALTHQRGTAPAQLNCLSPINVRSHLTPAVGEQVGLYISYGVTTHELRFDSLLWETARSVKSQLFEAMLPGRFFEDIHQRQPVMATCPDAITVAQGMQQQYSYDLLVTNLGRLTLGQQFGSLRIEALYGPAVMAGVEQEHIVGVATLGDRLSLTVCYPSTTSATEADTILAKALQLLDNGVDKALIHHSAPYAVLA